MNYVHIIGRLGKDPEVRYTSDNKKVTSFSLASNYFKGGQEETVWWRVTVWGERWDKIISYLSKGKAVMVGGEMRKPETYVDKSGQTKIGSIEVTADYVKFVPYGPKEEDQQNSQGSYQQQKISSGTESGSGSFVADEEPLPF